MTCPFPATRRPRPSICVSGAGKLPCAFSPDIRGLSSRPSTTFNLDQFNRGDYYKAIEQKQAAENITSVLYPNDNTEAGKEVRDLLLLLLYGLMVTSFL
jgi:hypothetical protein